jgi:hypothetical protein
VHRVDAPCGTPVREGGWAVADDTAPPTARTGPGWALAHRADGLTSALVGLHGWSDDEGTVVAAAGGNAYGHHSATPILTLPSHPGGTRLMVTLVVLSADPVVHASAEGARVRVTADGSVEIRFPDGRRESVS